jgi:hypothetical protein
VNTILQAHKHYLHSSSQNLMRLQQLKNSDCIILTFVPCILIFYTDNKPTNAHYFDGLSFSSFIPSLLHVSTSICHLQGALLRSLLSYTKTVHAVLVVLVKKPLHSLFRVIKR